MIIVSLELKIVTKIFHTKGEVMTVKDNIRKIMSKRKKWRSYEILEILENMSGFRSESNLTRRLREMDDVSCVKEFKMVENKHGKLIKKPIWFYQLG